MVSRKLRELTDGTKEEYKNEDGTLNYLGRTDNTTFTVTNPKGGNTTYVIKAAYSLFKANMSDGLLIKSNSDIDSNVENIIKPDPGNDDTEKNYGLD
mgnify:FL=1